MLDIITTVLSLVYVINYIEICFEMYLVKRFSMITLFTSQKITFFCETWLLSC